MPDRASIQIEPVAAEPVNAVTSSNMWTRAQACFTVQNGKVFTYFTLWFSLSVVYNVCNKKAHQALDLPMFLSLFQMSSGLPVIFTLWATGVKTVPSILDRRLTKALSFMALCHSGTHLAGVGSMGLGAVSFTHIIKSSEPVFTAALSVVVLGQIYSWQVYMALGMVCVGVSVASVAELDMNALALILALVSALCASFRGTLSKELLKSVPAEHGLQAQNLYYVLTILSTIFCAVISALTESVVFIDKFNNGLLTKGHGFVWGNLIASGLAYYLYNEVSFLALEAVSPVTHAIGSTFKRVFIIGTTLIVFQNPVNGWGYAGSAIAIISVFVYSLAKTRYPGWMIKKPFAISLTSKC